MITQRTGLTGKLLALAAIFGIGVFSAMVLWGCSGCSRTASENFQYSSAEGLYGAGIRPAAGDTVRVLRNAHYLKMMGRPEMALRELEGAYQEDPRNLRVLDTLARTYEELGEFDRAQKLYQQALALDPSNQAVNNNLCFSYYLTGQYEKAETCFRQTLAKNPQNLTVRNNLGLLLCRLGRAEEAHHLWKEAEGEIAAEKKVKQVTVALGLGEQPRYAQSVQPAPAAAPVASVSGPRRSLTPPPGAAPDRTPAVAALPSAPAPKAQPLAAASSKVREPGKVAADSGQAAVQHHQAPAASAASGKPAPLPPASAKTKSESPAPGALAKTGAPVDQKKAAAKVPAAAQPPDPDPPLPPRKAAASVKKPAPALTPPSPKPGRAMQVAGAPKPAPLTAEKLDSTGIEVTNGTSARDLARQTRTQLSEEGFQVVSIGNYRDYSVEKTVVYYRPGAEDVARALSAKFFPKASLETGEKFARGADIKLLLGRDAVTPPTLANEPAAAAEKIAAGLGSVHPELKPAAPAPVAAVGAAPRVRPQASAPAALPASAKAAPPEKSREHPYLTAAELETMGLDIRNGTPAPDLAHKARNMLSQEGFNVVHIGNHIDFGAEKTIIYYRQGAEKMARNLNSRFFPHSQMEQSAKLPGNVAVKVLLGNDLLQRTDVMAKLSE